MPNGKLTLSFSETGTYSAYVTSYNSAGYFDSSPITFTVSPQSVTIKLDGNGGTVSKSSFDVKVGSKLDGLSNASATKTGYTFSGWFTDKSGGTQVKATDTASKSMTLYAHWTAKTIAVTFYRNQNSSDTSSVKETFTYGTSNQKFGYKTDGSGRYNKMNNPAVGFGEWTKTGYSLLGWNKDKNATSSQYSTYSGVADDWINSNSPAINLYAVWKANTYDVSLIYNDGTDKKETVKVTYDSNYNLPSPTRTGYNFNGWYTAADNGTQVTNNDKVKIIGAQTLYAYWSENSTSSELKYGDANCDNEIDMSDAVIIMQALSNPNKYGTNGTAKSHMSEQGVANADCDKSSKGLTTNDALAIQLFLLKKVNTLPIT